jgi:hypothetical protein
MPIPSPLGACFAAALILAPAVQASNDSPPHSTQPINQQASSVNEAQAEQPPPQTRRQGRTPKRSSRTSKREPGSRGGESFQATRPPRVAGPTSQGLAFVSNVVTGYDDNLLGSLGAAAGPSPTPMASGSAGVMDGMLAYRVWNARRSLVVAPTGIFRANPSHHDKTTAGGTFDLDGWAWVGQRTRFGGAQILRYDPLLRVSAITSAPLSPGGIDVVPAAGLYRKPSVNNASNLEVERFWGRDSTWITYAYRTDLFTEEAYGDSSSHDVLTEHRRILSGWLKARGVYRYIRRDTTAVDGNVLASREHWVEGVADFRKALSRERHVSLSIGAGAAHLASLGSSGSEPYGTWVPRGRFNAMFALSPSWSVGAAYQRHFSLLRGVTDSVYTTDTGSLSSTSVLTDRTSISVGATYSNSITPKASGIEETFKVYGAALQVGFAFNRKLSANAGYYYYHHRYSNPGALASGFPAEYGRQAFRIGLTLWVPLAGVEHRWSQPVPRL